MEKFETKQLPADADVLAPDGSAVRILLSLTGGSMAHFELGPGETSRAAAHRSVDELWYFLSGSGQMWRSQGERSEIVEVCAGTCISIPAGTRFQFRCTGSQPLAAVGVTMPPWPGEGEAVLVQGPWEPSLRGAA